MNDMTEKKLFTVSVFAENAVGVLNQVTAIYTRRCINIESITASACSIPGVHKFTMTAFSDSVTMEKVVKQIEKRIDVIKAFLYTDDDIVYQEVAYTKFPLKNFSLRNIWNGSYVNTRHESLR